MLAWLSVAIVLRDMFKVCISLIIKYIIIIYNTQRGVMATEEDVTATKGECCNKVVTMTTTSGNIYRGVMMMCSLE